MRRAHLIWPQVPLFAHYGETLHYVVQLEEPLHCLLVTSNVLECYWDALLLMSSCYNGVPP